MSNRLRTVYTGVSLTALASLFLAGATLAQTQPAPAQPAAAPQSTTPSTTTTDTGTTTVTVTAAKPQNRIDRQVYDNNKNIDSTSGTAADALNHVPSVNVDNQGNLTLRGNANVQVYVDGKPSAMMQGDNRAAALQAMSSNDIDSVEVMNNPGAQYSSEGTAGIINLVMKKNRKPGGFGIVNVSGGDDGRYNGNLTGLYNAGKLSFSGSLNFRHDSRIIHNGTDLERLDPTTGDVVADTQSNSVTKGKSNSISGNGGVDYAISDKDSIGAQVSVSHRDQGGNTRSDYAVYNPTGGATSVYTRNQTTSTPHEDEMLDLHWDHTGKLAGETLKVDARMSRSDGYSEIDGTDLYSLPVQAPTLDANHSAPDLKEGVFSVDYNRPVGQDLLSAGAQVTYDDNEIVNRSTGIGSLTSALSSDFAYTQTITALYVTYQKALTSKLTILGGVRMEALDLKTDEVGQNGATDVTGHIDYTKVSPSFFATYALSDRDKLRFQYSHRLQRPAQTDLNPFITYTDATDVTAGNPRLKPQETDSYELRYEATRTGLTYSGSLYYKNSTHSITSYSFFVTPGVLETTKQNFGSGQSTGIELVASGALTPKLKLNADANFYYQELTTPGIGGRESGTTPSGHVNLSYMVMPKDTIQFNFFTSGKTLTGQGYRSAFAMGNLSYRHQFTQKLALNATVNDPFRSAKIHMVTENNLVHNETEFSIQAPTVYVGLSYQFGGTNASQQQKWQGGPPGGYRGGPGGGGPGGGY